MNDIAITMLTKNNVISKYPKINCLFQVNNLSTRDLNKLNSPQRQHI